MIEFQLLCNAFTNVPQHVTSGIKKLQKILGPGHGFSCLKFELLIKIFLSAW